MKYIIELDEIPNTGLFKARGANTLVFDRKGIKNILNGSHNNKRKKREKRNGKM